MNPSAGKAHLDELLDAALAGTFPASDPVSGLHATGGPAGGECQHEPDQENVRKHAVDEPRQDERRRRRTRQRQDDVIHGEMGEDAVRD